jgi:hypothetical protein
VDYNKPAEDKSITFSDFLGYNNDYVTIVSFSIEEICDTSNEDKEDQDRGQNMKEMYKRVNQFLNFGGSWFGFGMEQNP